VLLPAALIVSGLLRAMWALRTTTRIGAARAARAFANWLSLSWTVSLACLQALLRSEMVFMRTPKTSEDPLRIDALRMAKAETLLALLLWTAGVLAGSTGRATPFLLALFAWQGIVYGTSFYMSWLNVRSTLPPYLERRRRTEPLRDRRGARLAFALGSAGALVAATALAVVLFLGGSNPGEPQDPFTVPASLGGDSPLSSLLQPATGPSGPPGSTTTGPTGPSATGPTATGPTGSTTAPTPTPTPSPTSSPSPSADTAAAASPTQ
jgi:hypothetical protein